MCQLLGGKFRDRIRLYCDTGTYRDDDKTPKHFADSAKEAVKMGFNAVKYDIDERDDPSKYDACNWTVSPSELEGIYNQVAAIRKGVGPKIDVRIGMYGKYDATTGERVAKMLEPLNLM